jgi:hypothetical protein
LIVLLRLQFVSDLIINLNLSWLMMTIVITHSSLRKNLISKPLSPDSICSVGILDPVLVSKILNQHFSGQASYGFELWGLAILVAWFRARVARAPLPSRQTPLIERHFPLKAVING